MCFRLFYIKIQRFAFLPKKGRNKLYKTEPARNNKDKTEGRYINEKR